MSLLYLEQLETEPWKYMPGINKSLLHDDVIDVVKVYVFSYSYLYSVCLVNFCTVLLSVCLSVCLIFSVTICILSLLQGGTT